MMPERKYVADFTADCTERVSDEAAFINTKKLYDCFRLYMEVHYPCATPIRPKLFLQLFDSQDGMRELMCMKGFLAASPKNPVWGFKNLALSPAGKKLMEATK